MPGVTMPLVITDATTTLDIQLELARLRDEADKHQLGSDERTAIDQRRDDLADHWLRLKRHG